MTRQVDFWRTLAIVLLIGWAVQWFTRSSSECGKSPTLKANGLLIEPSVN
jgi:hypothetical protein